MLGVELLLLVQRGERVEVEEGIIGNDAAGGLRFAEVLTEHGRVLDNPRPDVEVAKGIQGAMLDALGLALG